MYLYICICICIYVYVYVFIYICICICICIMYYVLCICIYVYVYVYLYVYIEIESRFWINLLNRKGLSASDFKWNYRLQRMGQIAARVSQRARMAKELEELFSEPFVLWSLTIIMFFGSKFSFAWVWLWCKPKAFPFTVTWDSSGRRSLIFALATFSNPRDVCPRSVAPVGSWGPNFPLSAAVTSRVLRGTELRCRGATTLAGQMRREMSKPVETPEFKILGSHDLTGDLL